MKKLAENAEMTLYKIPGKSYNENELQKQAFYAKCC